MADTFHNKIIQERARQKKSHLFEMDLFRFVVIIFITVLLGMVYKLENIDESLINILDQVSIGRLRSDTVMKKDNLNEKIGWRYENNAMKDLARNFDMIDKDEESLLGGVVEERGGYLGTFDRVNDFFELLMPYLYSNELVFSKNDVSVTIMPIGSNLEYDVPQIENNKLIYDDVFPSILAVRKFNHSGMSEYLILKNEEASKVINYRISVSGGEAKIIGNKLIVVDESNKKELKLIDYRIIDVNKKSAGEVILNKLGSDVIEIRLDIDPDAKYPLILVGQ
jgi:hypothetical protein